MAELIEVRPLIVNHGADDGNTNNILRWIIRVDEHIDKESLDIMKLGMRGELTQTERDAAHRPSDLYHALVKHYEEPVALARFIYALENLGHRRHGHRAVRQLSEFSIPKPGRFDPVANMSREEVKSFQFYQCLVDVLVHLEEEYYPKLISHFTKTYLQGINPNTIDSPCALFTQLQDKAIIKRGNTDILADGLRKIGDYRNADRVVKYIHSYSQSRDEPFTCLPVTSPSDTSSMTDTEAAPNKKGFNRKRIFFSALISTIILLCTLFSIICSAVYQYLTENDTALVSLRSNSTVVLFDQEPSKTLQSLTVTEDTNHPGDFDHEIIVYQVDLSCGDIEVQEETYQQTGTDFSLINGTTSYALAGSSMTYNICGSTNSSYQSERLELVLLYGLEALQAPSTDYDKFYYFSYGTDGNWTCKEVTYNIENKGYYTPVFLTAPQEATFTYSMTYRQRFLNEPLPLSLSDYILSNDKDRLALNGLSVGQHCFIATILENPTGTSPHVHVHLSYEYNQHYIAYILFGADASLHLLVFILCILFCVFCW